MGSPLAPPTKEKKISGITTVFSRLIKRLPSGSKKAKVEFANSLCPFCAAYQSEIPAPIPNMKAKILNQIKEDFLPDILLLVCVVCGYESIAKLGA